MRTFAFTLAIAVGALGASSGFVAQGGRMPVLPTAAHVAYGRLAGFYKLVDGARRGYLAYDPAGYVSLTTQTTDRQTPAAMGGYTAYFGTFAVDDAAHTVTHVLFGALQPRVSLADQVQRFSTAGNRLTLQSPSAMHDAPSGLTWERLPDLTNLTPTHRQLIGFWKLVSTERRTTRGELARAYPGWTGFLVYAPSGHMMVHMMEPYRRGYAGNAPTPEEAQAATRTYTSYFGTYTLAGGGSLIHHMEGSINPSNVGTDTQRFFEVSGTTLVLRPPLIKTPEGDVIMTNIWERLTE